MSSGVSFKWFSSSAKAEHPDGVSFNSRRRYGGGGSDFVGIKNGVSANFTFMKLTKKISEDIQIAWNGASLGGSFGARFGSENAVAAMIEPSLAKTDLNCGPVCASLGLNANTGIKLGDEGFKVGIAGFGLTMGIGGKFSFDSPVGSLGFSDMGVRNAFQSHQREPALRCNVLTVDWSKELDPHRFERERREKLKKNLVAALSIILVLSIATAVIYNYPYAIYIAIGHAIMHFLRSPETEFDRADSPGESCTLFLSSIITMCLWLRLAYDLTIPLAYFLIRLLLSIFFSICNNIVMLVVLGVLIGVFLHLKDSE